MSEINVLPSTPSTVVIDDDEATTSGISICTSVSGSYNSGDCGDGVCDYDENCKEMLDQDNRCCKQQRRQSNCSNSAELQKLTTNLEQQHYQKQQQQQQLNNQNLPIPSNSQIPQTASSSTILNATPSAATIASVVQLKKTNLLSTYLRRIFHHCKVN